MRRIKVSRIYGYADGGYCIETEAGFTLRVTLNTKGEYTEQNLLVSWLPCITTILARTTAMLPLLPLYCS